MNDKTAFIEYLASNLNRKMLIVDFDTQFTALSSNKLLNTDVMETSFLTILLPHRLPLIELINKIQEAMESKMAIILDSLSGLLDYLNTNLKSMSGYYQPVQDINNHSREHSRNNKGNSPGHVTLIFLKLLFKSPDTTEIPVIFTSYVSFRAVNGLIRRLVNLDDNSLITENHYEKISHSISIVKYDLENKRLFYTIILNKNSNGDNLFLLQVPRSMSLG